MSKEPLPKAASIRHDKGMKHLSLVTSFNSVIAAAVLSTGIALVPSAARAAQDLSFELTSAGVIADSAAETCVDRVNGVGASAAAPAASFEALRLVWAPKDRDLVVQQLTLTFTSPKLQGGSRVVNLSSDEVAALLGTPWGIVSADPANGNKEVISNQPGNRGNSPLCNLVVGSLTFASSTPGAFTAKVTLELIGLAVDSANGGNQKSVRQTIKTTAQFLN